MPTTNLIYYPAITDIVKVDNLPEFLSFIKTGIENILDKVYYKDYYFSKNISGSDAFYSLTIISKTKIAIELPGTEIYLVLNPDFADGDISSFPFTLFWHWEFLRYIRNFNISGFSFSLENFFNLALQMFGLSEVTALEIAVNAIVIPDSNSISNFSQLVNDINTLYGSSIVIDEFSENRYDDLIIAVRAINKEVFPTIFGLYIVSNDNLEEGKQKLNTFFSAFVPYDLETYVKDILIPKIRATLHLSAAIEFPRKILMPYKKENGVLVKDTDETIETKFLFAEADFYADTEEGIGYKMDIAGTLYPTFSEIANTGLLIQIQRLKLDLSKTKNIPEADALGYPVDFTGVYADAVSVTLPPRWFSGDSTYQSTLRIGGYNLLIGSGGGVTGTFALEAVPVSNGDGTVTSFFSDHFHFNFPITGLKIINKEIEEVTITQETLLPYINSLPDRNQYRFKFPLNITKTNGQVVKINSQTEFRSLINSYAGDQDFMWFDLGKSASKSWKLGFKKFDIEFYHGQIVHSSLHAALEIKKYKTFDEHGNAIVLLINLEGEWVDRDDFRLSATFLPEGFKIPIWKSLILTLQTAELGKSDGVFFIGADTKISFPEESLAAKLFKATEIDLPALRIYANGKFELAGGTSFIPVNFNLPLGPINMSVKGLHLGSIQREHNGVIREYNYIGFDGAMSIDPIGLDVTGTGVKYYYTTDDDAHGYIGDNYFHIARLDFDLVIPGSASESQATAIIHGSLTIPEPGVSGEYSGSVSVKLPQPNISTYAAMRLYPKYSAFYIEASAELPTPIPLGPIGIFGFRGLIGKKYVAEKASIGMDENNTWYDYYVSDPRGINMDKFSTPPKTLEYKNPFSIGIGASMALTGGDRIVSLRAMMLLSIPSVFVIDAGLTILSEKLGLAENDYRNPPFYAFIAIGDNSLEFGAGADFGLNKTDKFFLQIHAEIQMGFFFKNQRPWYINFGTREKPITAHLLKDIFNIQASSFLMIAAKGIEAGARVGIDFSLLGFIRCWVIIEVGSQISFERPQIGGFIYLEGGAEVDIVIFKVAIVLAIYFSLEMVKPFLIYAQLRLSFEFRIGPKWLHIKIKINLVLTLKWEKNKTVDFTPIAPLTIANITDNPDFIKDKRVDDLVKGIHMLTNEEFKLEKWKESVPTADSISRTIPLDTFLDIKFEKGVAPGSLVDVIIGGHTGMANNHIELIPPQEGQPGGYSVRQVKHKYSIEKIELKSWNPNAGGQWEDYNPYKALLEEDDISVDHLKIGQWQRSNDQYDTIRILGTTPFSFMDSGEPGWFIPEQYGITPSELFCSYKIKEMHRSNFLNLVPGTVFYPPTQYQADFISGAYYAIEGTYFQEFDIDDEGNSTQIISDDKIVIKEVTNVFLQENGQPYNLSLEFSNASNLIITPPEAIAEGALLLTTYASGVTIEFFEKDKTSTSIKPKYINKKTVIKTKQELANPVKIDMAVLGIPVSQIRIIPDANNKDRITQILEEIAQIYYIAELRLSGSGQIVLTAQEQIEINNLENELTVLKENACSDVGCKNLVFKKLADHFNVNYQVLPAYIINDETTFQNILNEVRYPYTFNIDFNNYSILILEVSSRFEGQVISHYDIKKITDKGSQLCLNVFNINQNNSILNYGNAPSAGNPSDEYNYSIFQIEKVQEKPIIKAFEDCGCNDVSVPFSVCTTSLQEFNWMTLTEKEYYETIPGQPALNENSQAMIDALNKTIQPIWRPNTKYYLHFQLKDEVNNGKNASGIFNYFYGFQTKGPIGHYHKQVPDYMLELDSNGGPIVNSNGDLVYYKEEEKAIASLRSYIDYKRSYPNADGNLLMSKPLFYGNEQCELSIYFDSVYTPHMFSKWKSYNGMEEVKGKMVIMIKDPVSDTIIPFPLSDDWSNEDVPKPTISWEDDNDPRLPLSVQVIRDYVNYVNENSTVIHCTIDFGEPLSPATQFSSVKLSNLKPEKLYTALVYNAYDANGDGIIQNQTAIQFGIRRIIYEESQKVHDYVFRTSRYQNFREQVKSYALKELDENNIVVDQKSAVYEVRIENNSTMVNDLYALVSNGSTDRTEELKLQYLHEFDRAVEGILKLRPLNPPANTEFVKIVDNQSEHLIAILVRNPEPFNDPKIPKQEIESTLTILGDKYESDGEEIRKYRILWSKDYSQALIMHETKKITDEGIQFIFTYKTWDGNERKYVVKDESEKDPSLRLNTVVTDLIIFND